jgi:stage II sporulation protein E
MVCGTRNCRIIVRGSHFDRSGETLKSVQTAFERICATRLTMPFFEPEGDGSATSVMRLFSEPTFDTVYAGSTVPAGSKGKDGLPLPLTNQSEAGEYQPPATCGDHIALFKSDSACFYALISDGMGSGEEASLTSDVCALFLEKMLSAGNRVELSVRMLNSFIRQKNNGTGEECSATVDLMELDLMSGRAVFAKNGAAPTYVVRGGRVYKIRSRTLPIGILRDSDPQLLRFRMYPGDVVVMVSDGVTNGNDECPWLIDLLSSPLPDSMDSLRMKILRHAIASGSPDDLSAIAIRVEENNR